MYTFRTKRPGGTAQRKRGAAGVEPASIVRARDYAERTHEEFLSGLRKAAKLDRAAYGVLAGPVKTSSVG
jgi:hypothetical protein